ncbi:hypothetical protein THOM_2156 [Trachipleistophora hominis]|uniref:Uncharacterized protein n=1 Tax=Trachipleistophora hominis TaxID=72359 RepID=L7JUC5_TRAHO|nr:hypothetical protein THOM_2156 [Trachipleistophora hominis]
MFFLIFAFYQTYARRGYNQDKVSNYELRGNNYGLNVQNHVQMHSYETQNASTIESISDTSTGYSIKLHARQGELDFRVEGNSLFITFSKENEHMEIKNQMRIDVINNDLHNFYAKEIHEDNDAYTVINLVFENPNGAEIKITKNFSEKANYES